MKQTSISTGIFTVISTLICTLICTAASRSGAALALLAVTLLSFAASGGVAHASADDVSLPHVRDRIAAHQPLRIVAFGSSSTEGIGASSPAATYPARLQTYLADALPGEQVTVRNEGIGGQDAEEFHQRLAAVIAEKPDLVIFQTGTNALLRHLPADRFASLTRADIAAMRAAGIDVVMLEQQYCRVFADTPGAFGYVELVRHIAADLAVPDVRRWDLMQAWLARHEAALADLQSPDGLHMADKGYAMLARAVRDTILAGAGMPNAAKAPIVSASR